MHLLPHCRIEIFITTAGVVGSNIETQTFFSHFSRTLCLGGRGRERDADYSISSAGLKTFQVRPPPPPERETQDTGLAGTQL